jgi:hypothetical protein
MASVRSTIELIITGSTRGLGAAAAEARAMAERIAAAEDRVSDARRRQAEANSRVAEAETRLNAARARSGQAAQAVADAESRTAQARSNSLNSANELSRAEAELNNARANGSSQEIAQAEERIRQARQRAQQDARNLATLEQQLATARSRQNSSSSAVAALEERLARARGQQFRASEDLARAENNLNATRRRGTDDMNRQRDGILGIFDALGRLADAFSGADGASTSLLNKMAALNSVFGSIGGPIIQAVVGILQFVAILGAAGEIVGVVGGLIGQALAGVPALLFAIGAAGGTVALGLDGIKKAAEAAAPAFGKLKAAVSDTFQRLLTPVFRELAAVIPVVTGGFTEMAGALSNAFARIVGVVGKGTDGLHNFQIALTGAIEFIRPLADGIARFFSGFLNAAAAAAPAMEALGAAIGNIFGRIGDVFNKLANDGTIQKAVAGLAATIDGLSAVIAPVIELLIRMGAALGDSVGVALQGVGSAITQVTPFFVKLADVAGKVLVDAFKQLGPPLSELVSSILPGAGAGLDGLASIMHNVVLPAIAGFINFLRTDGIPGIVAFTKGAIVQFLEFGKGVIAAMDGVLATVQGLFTALALIPGPFQQQFAEGAAVIKAYRGKLDELKTTINGMESKVVAFTVQVPEDRTTGERGVLGVAAAMDRAAGHPQPAPFTVQVPSDRTTGEQGILGVVAAQERVQNKTVTTTANVPESPTQGTLGNTVLEGAIGAVINKSVTTTSQVPGTPVLGTQGNQALKGAIDAVPNKAVTTTGKVPEGPTLGKQGNVLLKGAIDQVNNKGVTVTAKVVGTDAVHNLISAIAGVVNKTVTIVAKTIGNPFGLRASGGPVIAGQSYLVGEKGPELLTMGSTSGFVTDAQRTRQIMSNPTGAQPSGTPATGGDAPITVNVLLSQEQIAGIARVEIARRDRATRRTVLAGSGDTF